MTSDSSFKDALGDFAAVAGDFCAAIQNRALDADGLWAVMDEMLPLLYYHGGSLTTAAPRDLFAGMDGEPASAGKLEDLADRSYDMGPEEADDIEDGPCAKLRADLAGKFGDADSYFYMEYWGLADGEPDYDICEARYSEDLSELYHSLVHTLDMYRSGLEGVSDDCARAWVRGFSGVWGPTIPRLLGNVFRELYGTLTEEEADSGP